MQTIQTAPRSRPRGLPGGIVFALVITLFLACRANDRDEEDDNQFRPSVLACEEALARLVKCCPGFDPSRVECEFYFARDEGCGTTTTERVEPAFTLPESQCILDTECADLAARNVCPRAQAARVRCATTTTGPETPPTSRCANLAASAPTARVGVCP